MTDALIPVFDLGGVFVDWNPFYLLRKLFDSEEEAVRFHREIYHPLNLEFDGGKPFAEGIAEWSVRFPHLWQEIAAIDTRWRETLAATDAGTVAIHNALIAAGVPTYAITNFSAEKFMSIWPDHPFLGRFNGIVVSGIEKIIKPDPRIFGRFCDRYDLDPARCVFVDDSAVNVAAARAFGMQAIQFTTAAALRPEMAALGLPIDG